MRAIQIVVGGLTIVGLSVPARIFVVTSMARPMRGSPFTRGVRGPGRRASVMADRLRWMYLET